MLVGHKQTDSQRDAVVFIKCAVFSSAAQTQTLKSQANRFIETETGPPYG